MLKLIDKSLLITKITALLLCCTFAAQWTSGIAWLCYYNSHVNYITAHFCVNKDHPEMHCNGKCYLHKKLRQNEKQKDGNQLNNISRNDIILFMPEAVTAVFINSSSADDIMISDNKPLQQGFFQSVFHPPVKVII